MTEFKPLPSRRSTLLMMGCLLLAGCRPSGWQPPPESPRLPLPPWPERSADQLPFLFAETEKRLVAAGPGAYAGWRRLSWIHQQRGARKEALKALEQAVALLDTTLTTVTQQTAERSALADQYLELGAPERAQELLQDYRYQGTVAKSIAALQRPTLTQNERTNLTNLDILLYPRLVLALVDQGPREVLRKELQSRLDFALMRGPDGGRVERFHNAVLLQFHLGDPLVALKATALQSPPEQVRTLSCLLWGGTLQVSAVLFQRDRFASLEARVTPALKQALQQQLRAALQQLKPAPPLDIELSAIATLARKSGLPELAQVALARVADTTYKTQSQTENQQGQYPRLPRPDESLRGFDRTTFQGRNLGRIMGVQDVTYQAQLVEEFMADLHSPREWLLFSSHLARLCWELKRVDLIEQLMRSYPEPAFQCHQTLKRGSWALENNQRGQAKATLYRALAQLDAIPKASHHLQETMLAVNLARALEDSESLAILRKKITELLPQVTIVALRTEGQVYLAGLHYECGDRASYAALCKELGTFDNSNPFETVVLHNRLQRLAQELTKLGAYSETITTLNGLRGGLGQAAGLMEIAETLLKTPPMVVYGPTASLQNGPGAGRGLPGTLR